MIVFGIYVNTIFVLGAFYLFGTLLYEDISNMVLKASIEKELKKGSTASLFCESLFHYISSF